MTPSVEREDVPRFEGVMEVKGESSIAEIGNLGHEIKKSWIVSRVANQ